MEISLCNFIQEVCSWRFLCDFIEEVFLEISLCDFIEEVCSWRFLSVNHRRSVFRDFPLIS
jgi:hypothetical protein